jgi:2-polyprenyl-3-methyl-5-hydroxy-6-metoxy-1,4-benzoquinol methylase/ribosomal protein S27E
MQGWIIGNKEEALLKEEEIRTMEALNRYLRLVEEDAKKFFNFGHFVEINCPACNGDNFVFEFEKIGFKYVSCKRCATLFVNPRPPLENIRKFYSNSPSANFWVNKFFKPMAEARREKIFKPRVEYVGKLIDKNKKYVIGDIGAGFGLFLEELRKISPQNEYIAVEPSIKMADICRAKGLKVRCSCLEDDNMNDMAGKLNLLTAFELIEHLHDPGSFFKKAHLLLRPNGSFLMTTLNGMGFDILLLWEKSKNLNPPHHLNFFNPASMRRLLERVGFEIEEIATPGQLDWDIVEGMIKNEGVSVGKFWDSLAHKDDNECKAELQRWIAKNNLSSHMRILAKKRGD